MYRIESAEVSYTRVAKRRSVKGAPANFPDEESSFRDNFLRESFLKRVVEKRRDRQRKHVNSAAAIQMAELIPSTLRRYQSDIFFCERASVFPIFHTSDTIRFFLLMNGLAKYLVVISDIASKLLMSLQFVNYEHTSFVSYIITSRSR